MNAPVPAACPILPADDVRVLLTQGRAWIDALSKLEGWPDSLQADLRARLSRQPAATLQDEVEYFRRRLIEAQERARPRGVVPVVMSCPGCKVKRDRRGFPTGVLSCVGTPKSCLRVGEARAPPTG